MSKKSTTVAAMKPVYSFRQGYQARGLSPDAVGAELARLEAEGTLTPEQVIQAAANPTSPLHAGFTWDDTEAARQHRLSEARRLLRAIEVRYPNRDPIPVYVHVSDYFTPKEDENNQRNRGAYLQMTTVATNVDLFSRTLAEFRGKVASLSRSAEQLISLAKTESRRVKAREMQRHIARLERNANETA